MVLFLQEAEQVQLLQEDHKLHSIPMLLFPSYVC